MDQFLIITIVATISASRSGATTPDPGCYTVTKPPSRSCLEKYRVVGDHIYCQMDPSIRHPSDAEMTEIASIHNTARSKVNPPAADMIDIAYSKGNERPALVWTQMCRDKTFSQYQRFLPGYTFMGLNTLVSRKNMTWTEVVDNWLQENSSFTYGSKNDPQLVSNFSQIIWAETSVVGCAKHECPNGEYRYACAYAPGVEVKTIDKPYTSDVSSCSSCPGNCTNNLCDCNGILCLNGGDLDLDTCTCTCPTGNNYYGGLFCELYCKPNGDNVDCGKKYTKATCETNRETAFKCPWMCDLCPYAGKNYTRNSVPMPYQRGKKECTTPGIMASSTPNSGGTGSGRGSTSGSSGNTRSTASNNGSQTNKQGTGSQNIAASLQQSITALMLTTLGLQFLFMNI